MKRISFKTKYGFDVGGSKSKSTYFTQLTNDADAFNVGVRLADDECYALFKSSEWVRAVVEKIIQSCTKFKLLVVPKDKTKTVSKSRIAKVQRFFDDPNANKEGFFEIRKKVLLDLLVINRGAIEKVWNKSGTKLLDIYSYDASKIKVRAKNGVLLNKGTYVVRGSDGKETTYNKNEMIFMVFCPSSSSWYGHKLMETLGDSVATDLLRSVYNSANFTNRGESSGILNLQGLNKTDMKRFRIDWESKHKGAANAHRLAVLNAQKVDYIKMALTNKDMEFSEYGREIMQKIFSVFGMMPYMMGVSFGAGAGIDPEKQIEVFRDGIIASLLAMEQYYYTNEIIKDGFGFDDLEVCFPEASLADKKKEAGVDDIDLKNGVIVINERRAKMQLPPVPWGDTPISLNPGGPQVDPNTGRLVPPNAQGEANGSKPEPKPAKKPEQPKKSLVSEYLENLVDNFSTLSNEVHIDKLFNGEENSFVKHVSALIKGLEDRSEKDKLIQSAIKLIPTIK